VVQEFGAILWTHRDKRIINEEESEKYRFRISQDLVTLAVLASQKCL